MIWQQLGLSRGRVRSQRVRFFSDVLASQQPRNPFTGRGGGKTGKRKVLNEENLENMLYPSKNDVLGMAVKMLGFDRILVKCQDGKERLCRVRGKLKRRVWIRDGDIVLVSPWDFQPDTRGDIFWRYRKNQTDQLRIKGYLTM